MVKRVITAAAATPTTDEVEEEKLSNGLLLNGIEDISEIKTLTPKSDSKDIIYDDNKYLGLLDGKETDL